MRFPLEVAQRLRAAIGPEICMGIRLSAEEFVPEGLTLEQAVEIARRAVALVQFDFIHVSHSAYHMSKSLGTQMADMGVDKQMFRHLPGAIRKAVADAPNRLAPVAIFTVCKFRDLVEADAMIASGDADMVGLARAHVADPAIVRKWREGKPETVVPCIGCNQGCAQNLERNMALTCLVNPRAGREGSWPETSAARASPPRTVLIVGGGPAGMEAAAIAAERGHRVRLLECTDRLGGRLRLAAGMRLREDFGLWLRFAEARLARLGVAIEFGHAATLPSIVAAQAHDRVDALFLATGAEPIAHVLPDGTRALTLDEAACADLRGERVAVYDETGDWGALGLVEHLAESGATVTLITPAAGALWRTTIYSTLTTFARWREKRIRVKTLRKPLRFSGGDLVLEDVSCGETETLSGLGALIGCVPPRAAHALEAPLIAAGIMPTLIGDCHAPRNAVEAIFEGQRTARAL